MRAQDRHDTIGVNRMLIVCMAVFLAVGTAVGTASGATTGALAEGWSKYQQYGVVSFSSLSDACVTASFKSQSFPTYCAATLVATGGDFTGNYAAAHVESLRFSVESNGNQLGAVKAVLLSGSGRLWRNENVETPGTDGVAVINTIPFTRAAGWTRDGRGDKDAMWADDLQDVVMVGVAIVQGGMDAQWYRVCNFVLLDEDGGTTPPAVLTPLQEALLDRFGVTGLDAIDSADAAVDSDEDGMTDLDEILSENDEAFANATFALDIVPAEGDGVTISWACVAGAKYEVLRTANLLDPGSYVVLTPELLEAGETGFMTFTDETATGSGPYYFKILKK